MNIEKIKAYLDSLYDKYGVPGGEIRIVKEGKEIWHYVFGDRVLPENEGKELHWFYSMSKVYTMTCMMQLIEKGILSLDQKVTDIFPGLLNVNPAIEKTTIRNLMSMTGGLDYNMDGEALTKLRAEDPDCFDPDKIVEAIYKDALVTEPGSEFNYSLCHDVCGAILWKVTGKPLDQYMKENIFDPLEIPVIGFFPDETQKNCFIGQYRRTGERVFEQVDNGNQLVIARRFSSGGAGLFGNLTSYMKLPEALANDGCAANGYQVLKPESIDILRTDQLTPMGLGGQLPGKFQDHGLESYSYALGVRTKIAEDGTSPVGEFGWDGAAGGYILIDRVNRMTVGYLQHTMDFGQVYGEIHPSIRKLIYENE